ncbi:hypothetical protein T492DRAFT_840055 [Pavlovales sp. CCMP2436]|nr:hypothetical protein T492DRAFT_840055 [Pavlovales sp. CCMP2436]
MVAAVAAGRPPARPRSLRDTGPGAVPEAGAAGSPGPGAVPEAAEAHSDGVAPSETGGDLAAEAGPEAGEAGPEVAAAEPPRLLLPTDTRPEVTSAEAEVSDVHALPEMADVGADASPGPEAEAGAGAEAGTEGAGGTGPEAEARLQAVGLQPAHGDGAGVEGSGLAAVSTRAKATAGAAVENVSWLEEIFRYVALATPRSAAGVGMPETLTFRATRPHCWYRPIQGTTQISTQTGGIDEREVLRSFCSPARLARSDVVASYTYSVPVLPAPPAQQTGAGPAATAGGPAPPATAGVSATEQHDGAAAPLQPASVPATDGAEQPGDVTAEPGDVTAEPGDADGAPGAPTPSPGESGAGGVASPGGSGDGAMGELRGAGGRLVVMMVEYFDEVTNSPV